MPGTRLCIVAKAEQMLLIHGKNRSAFIVYASRYFKELPVHVCQTVSTTDCTYRAVL